MWKQHAQQGHKKARLAGPCTTSPTCQRHPDEEKVQSRQEKQKICQTNDALMGLFKGSWLSSLTTGERVMDDASVGLARTCSLTKTVEMSHAAEGARETQGFTSITNFPQSDVVLGAVSTEVDRVDIFDAREHNHVGHQPWKMLRNG